MTSLLPSGLRLRYYYYFYQVYVYVVGLRSWCLWRRGGMGRVGTITLRDIVLKVRQTAESFVADVVEANHGTAVGHIAERAL